MTPGPWRPPRRPRRPVVQGGRGGGRLGHGGARAMLPSSLLTKAYYTSMQHAVKSAPVLSTLATCRPVSCLHSPLATRCRVAGHAGARRALAQQRNLHRGRDAGEGAPQSWQPPQS